MAVCWIMPFRETLITVQILCNSKSLRTVLLGSSSQFVTACMTISNSKCSNLGIHKPWIRKSTVLQDSRELQHLGEATVGTRLYLPTGNLFHPFLC